MPKSEVYSWRLSPELKASLEGAAREEGSSLSSLLERIARTWLTEHAPDALGSEEEERIRARAMRCAGTISLGDPAASTKVRQKVRERLARRRGR